MPRAQRRGRLVIHIHGHGNERRGHVCRECPVEHGQARLIQAAPGLSAASANLAVYASWRAELAPAGTAQTAADWNGYVLLNPTAHTAIDRPQLRRVRRGRGDPAGRVHTAQPHGVRRRAGAGLANAAQTGVAPQHVWVTTVLDDPIEVVENRFVPDPWSAFNTGQAAVTSPSHGAMPFDSGGNPP